MLKTILAACLCGMLLLPLPASAEEEAWQTAYRQFLTDYRKTDGYLPETTGEISFGSRWDLCDVDGDDIPELFISPDTSHAFGCRVYSFIDGEVVPLEIREGQAFGEYGLTKVCPEMHLIRAYHFGMGSEMVGYYAFDGAELTEVDRFLGTSVYISEEIGTEDAYQRNGADITEQEYNDGIASYEAYTWVESIGRAYSFNDLSPLEGKTVQMGLQEIPYEPEEPVNVGKAVLWGTFSAVILAALAALTSAVLRRQEPKYKS